MSHTIEMSATEAEARGIPVIRNKDALTKACIERGFLKEGEELVWKDNMKLGEGPRVSGYEVQLPGWTHPTYYNTEKGTVGFDNWSIFTPTHIDVRSGKRRAGEEGTWGEFQRLLDVEASYCEAASLLMIAQIEHEAALTGETARLMETTDEQYKMEILN